MNEHFETIFNFIQRANHSFAEKNPLLILVFNCQQQTKQ